MKAKGSGSSSASTKPIRNECPECDEGDMERFLVTCSVEVEGRSVAVPDVIVKICPACGARAWPAREIERAQEVARLKLAKKAA